MKMPFTFNYNILADKVNSLDGYRRGWKLCGISPILNTDNLPAVPAGPNGKAVARMKKIKLLLPPGVIRLQEFLLINAGLILTAAGIELFKSPNGFAIGGVSGIAIIVNHFLPGHNVGLVMLLINIVLNILGAILLGADFGLRTLYSSFALSGFVWVFEKLIPLSHPLTGDRMLELVYAIALPAIGSALVFNQNSSTGGTDIIARILTNHTHLHVGKTLLISDFLIAFAAIFALGLRQGMYSMLGLFLKGFVIDNVIESLNLSKKLEIITSRPEEMEHFILRTVHRGVTIVPAEGAYSGQSKKILTVVVRRNQAAVIRDFVHRTDPESFLIITNTSEILGKGFRHTDL